MNKDYIYIPEDYCSFELSKLLKEKGFSQGSKHSFIEVLQDNENDKKGDLNQDASYIINNGNGDYSNKAYYCCERPIHAKIIKWLRLKHEIEIEVSKEKKGVYFCFDNSDVCKTFITEGSSPEEAIEKCLLITLKKIK